MPPLWTPAAKPLPYEQPIASHYIIISVCVWGGGHRMDLDEGHRVCAGQVVKTFTMTGVQLCMLVVA